MPISIKEIDKILPQTQCQKCTFSDCYSYAKAIKNGYNYDKCITGGTKTLKELSILLNKSKIPNIKIKKEKLHKIAKINELICIGCKKCLTICPMDAIVGAKKLMHTVIENECTGCELCIKTCPMNCISLVYSNKNKINNINYENQKKYYRKRYNHHKQRINKKINEKIKLYKELTINKKIDEKSYIQKLLIKFKNKK